MAPVEAPVEVRATFWEKYKTHRECHIPDKVLNPDPCVQTIFKQTLMPFGTSPTRIVYPDPPKELKQTLLPFRTSEEPWPEAEPKQPSTYDANVAKPAPHESSSSSDSDSSTSSTSSTSSSSSDSSSDADEEDHFF